MFVVLPVRQTTLSPTGSDGSNSMDGVLRVVESCQLSATLVRVRRLSATLSARRTTLDNSQRSSLSRAASPLHRLLSFKRSRVSTFRIISRAIQANERNMAEPDDVAPPESLKAGRNIPH